jgi:hypothetical protein
MKWWMPATLMLAAGCLGGGTSIKGEIDGDEPVLVDGYFGQEDEIDPDTGDGLVILTLSDVPGACEAATLVWDEIEDAQNASDLEEAWEANLPEDFWEMTIVLRVSDPGDDQSGLLFEGVGWDEFLEKDEEAYATINHYKQHLDEDYWNGVADPTDYIDSWFTDGGDLEIKKHVPNELLKGTFVTEAADPADGDNEGDIEVKFSVDRCQGMERYLFTEG